MRVYKKIFCRMYQKIFHLAIPFLPYREPEILNSCADLGHILKKNTCHKVMIVTDQGIVEHRLLEPVVEELKISGIPYVVYDKTQANPSVKTWRKMNISDKIKGIQREDIKGMAIHAAKEANPLYPVPKLMDAEELEELYIKIADWSEEDAGK